MFVSRKKYVHALEQWEQWQNIANEYRKAFEETREGYDRVLSEAKEINDLNHSICGLNEAMLAELRKTEVELAEVKRKNGVLRKDYEVLMNDFEVLDAEYGKMEEERDHYQERCRYLEDEVTHYEEEKATRAADKIVEVGDMSLIIMRQSGLSLELSATVAEALYDAGYKREEIV